MIVGSCPSMTSLSDRNMSLGDVLLPQGGKQRCLCPRVQGLFTLRKVLLMQLSVALSLHYGWDSQLNTSEMFWIDISRWMISSRYWWISVYLLWRTAHALNLNLSCNVVSIGLRSWSCQLPSCNSFTSHSCFIVFWERDITSEHHETPVHITIIDHIRYLLFAFTYYCKHYLSLLSFAFNPLWTTRPEGLTTSLYSLGAKLFVSVCRSCQPLSI